MPHATRPATAIFWRLGLLACLLTGATSCSLFSVPYDTMFMMNAAQEIQFGNQVAQEVEKIEPLVTDPQVVDYVREVGRRLVRNAPPSEVPVRFFVVKDDSINAFAIPGGYVYVNTGLLRAADDEAELASVMAHEIGHVVRRHSARQFSRNVGADLFKKITLGDRSPQTIQSINKLVTQGILFSFSREDEFEADSIAVNTLYNSGYDPQAMNRLFGKLVQTYGEAGPRLKLLGPIIREPSTHPTTRERSQRVTALANVLPHRVTESSTTDLRRVQGRLKALNLIQ